MVDRSWSGKSENKRFSTTTKSRKSSSVSSEFDQEYREHLEGQYLGNGLEIRPPSGTNHQQPGSHLSIDTRLSELSLADDGRLYSSHPSSGTSKKSSQYKVLVDKPNCYITSPFKQGYQIPNKGPTKVVDPSIQLKKVTKESIDKVRQQFRRPKPPPHSSIYTPRLRKAKLKTTGRPISGSGPSINQCRGIQGGGQVKGRPTAPFCYYDNRSYTTHSPSLRPGSPTELHRPESSVHCTSRVPSVIDDSLSDHIIDTIYSNEHVTESWSGHTFNGEQTHDPRDQEGSLASSGDEKPEADLDEDHAEQTHDHFGPRDQRDQEGSLCSSGDEKPEADLDENHVIEDQKSTVHLSNDTEDKVTSKILGSSTKDNNETCKPFSETKGNNDSNSDDDDYDDENNKRTLLSSYNHQNSSKSGTQGWGSDKSGSRKKETGNGNEVKSKKNPKEMREEIQNEIVCERMTSMLSHCTKFSNSSEEGHHIKENNFTQKSDNNGIVHIVDSTSSNVSPLITIHVRGKLDKSGNYKPGTDSESFKSEDINNVEYPAQESDVIEECNDEEDTDRIPSALIWKNLDQLNLSMNASSDSSKDELTFSSRARKVQSAGPQRKTSSDLPSNMDSKPPRSKQQQRVSSGKSRKTKRKHHEQIDKTELLKKYLTEESKKFSADLPGYFTEQFHIIQEAKKDKTSYTSGPLEENTKALMKYNDNEQEGKEKDCDKVEDINEDKESTSLYSVEIGASSSSGVFFTMESTSTYDMDSLSEHTEDTLELGSDTKELSDDTGFETMPGLSRSQTTCTDKSMDDTLKHERQEEEVKFVKLEDLEVVAKAKHLTDPRTTNSHFKCCPYEPLNFTINAQPPPGYLFYFAYGVDMNAKRMSLYLRREYKRLWGVLFGFKLRFNKKGSSNDAGGFANVEFSPGSSVEGCVYTITDADLSMLDNCMGYPKHYCRVVLPVWMSNCHDPDQHGVAQYCIPAVLYVAEQQWVEYENIDTLDCTYSVNQCLKASDILTPNYIDYLSQQATT